MQKKNYTIKKLGLNGDGICPYDEINKSNETQNIYTPHIYVPYTLPNEEISLIPENLIPYKKDFKIQNYHITKTSPERVTPPCPYFTKCGGCQMQHTSQTLYRTWKETLLKETLKKNHIPIPHSLEHLLWEKPKERRRITLHLQCKKEDNTKTFFLGFYAPSSHDVIDITECSVITKNLENVINIFQQHKKRLYKLLGASDITLTELNNPALGTHYDIAIKASKIIGQQTPKTIYELCNFDNTRLMIEDEKGQHIYGIPSMYTHFAGVRACFPAGSFLQASINAQEVMITYIKDLMSNKHSKNNSQKEDDIKILDLFCGSGTFTLPLLEKNYKVVAVDAYEPSVKALSQSALDLGYSQNLFAQIRNLDQYPLKQDELIHDVAIIDPPRSGAEKQIKHIATSRVKQVIMISCHYPTFTRDLRHLLEGGYKLENLALIDQFLWTPHLEVIASLTKE